MEIKTKTMAEAHGKVCREIFENGDEIVTEDGELVFEYPEPIMVQISKPWMKDQISSFNNLNKQALESYAEQLITLCDADFAYTYGNRLFDYPTPNYYYSKVEGDGNGYGFNQIKWVIKLLMENPNTRRAVVMIRYPDIDCHTDNPPCLTTLQFFIRNGCLNMIAYLRSNDMLSAYGNNIYALHGLQCFVAEEILDRADNDDFWGCGSMTTISANAHIYFKRDHAELQDMKKEVYGY